MSDFLSNFNSGKYEKDKDLESDLQAQNDSKTDKTGTVTRRPIRDEDTEFDPKFKKKKQKKLVAIIFLTVVLILLCAYVYYQVSRTLMPNFINKPVSEVQKWAAKNKIDIETKMEYNLEVKRNEIIEQPIEAKKKIKKGSTLTFIASKGADPKEKIELPDFKKMNETEAEKWLKKNHIENLDLVTEFNENIPAGSFINQEFSGQVTKETFKREDSGKLVYSKGKEVYQKDISVPDFSDKSLTDVESWAKKNEIDLEIKKVASESVENGKIISQSIEAKEKIAKKTKMSVEASAGKGIVVPDFSKLTKETAGGQGNLQVLIEEQFSEDVPYGQLMSQSVESGTKLTEEDDLSVTVVYSAGKPYIKDLTGESEGDLQKLFFDEYQSKGANIDYVINYVESDEPKGTIVSADTFSTYLPLDYTVTINVSLGY